MTQGVFVLIKVNEHLECVRPKTKKALRIAIEEKPESVFLERTANSAFGSNVEFQGKITEMPEGETIYIVGPDPKKSRKWFANLTRMGTNFKFQ